MRAPAPILRVLGYQAPLALFALLAKDGPPWWSAPKLPARVTVTLGPCLPVPGPDADAAALTAEIERWFLAKE